MAKRNAQSVIVDEVEIPGKAGAVNFVYGWEETNKDQIMGMRHCCPCGCGAWGWMTFEAYGFKDCWKPQPKKGDDLTKLTLTPSIGFMKNKTTGVYHWHGFLKHGIFVEC
jgi:hypothetical protein